jgi:hypothetical protein
MKHFFRSLLVVTIALLSLSSLTGCKIPYASRPADNPSDNPPAASSQEPAAPAPAGSSQKSAATAPAFSLPDINTGQTTEFPKDLTGRKTALVFFSLT